MTPLFVDTNVLVYASRTSSQFHPAARDALARFEDQGEQLCLSRQVLREYLATVTRPQSGQTPIDGPTATAEVRRLIEIYAVLEDDDTVTDCLLGLLDQFPVGGKQVHDANIAATMLVYGIRRLLTFNEADFRRFGGLIEVVVP